MGLESRQNLKKSAPALLGAALIIAPWLAGVLVEAFLLSERTFLQHLQAQPPHELTIRLVAILLPSLAVGYLWLTLRTQRKLKGSLKRALNDFRVEKAKSVSLLEAFGDQISIQDTEFRILFQNTAHRKAMGDHLGEYCYQAYQQSPTVCPGCHLARTFSDGRPHRREAQAKTSEGLRHVEISSSPIHDADGRIIAGTEVVRDITERKRTEEKIQGLNRQLLERAEELEGKNEDLKMFAYSLSHDLRSPLTQLSLALQILREKEEHFAPGSRELLEIMDCSGRKMEEMIESMLLLSRISVQEVQLETVDLSSMALEVVASLSSRGEQSEVEVIVESGLQVQGDHGLLQQVMQNLLENAWKFSQGKQHPRIVVGQRLVEGERQFYVRDNGVGFDMERKKDLFTPFKRLHKKEDFPGTGIGLATVQRIIHRHRGEIKAESRPGEGAIFYFTIFPEVLNASSFCPSEKVNCPERGGLAQGVG